MGDWDPRAYGHVNNLQQEVARRALSDLMVSGDERVLDVGCGDGKVTALIMERLTTGSLLGVDPSLPMVEAARRRLSTASHAQFAVGTAATLPYDAEFDLATSFNALHWEIRWETALQRIRAALRPTGRAFLVFVCDGERPSIEDVTTETARSARWASWFEEFDGTVRARRSGRVRRGGQVAPDSPSTGSWLMILTGTSARRPGSSSGARPAWWPGQAGCRPRINRRSSSMSSAPTPRSSVRRRCSGSCSAEWR